MLVCRGVASNNYLGPGCIRDILRRWFFGPLYGYFISRLIWTGYEIRTSNFILFIDSGFIYLFTWSWITVYPFRFSPWTFGGMLIRHWSINICFYISLSFELLISFFLKNASIVCRLLIIWHLISIPKKKKKNQFNKW